MKALKITICALLSPLFISISIACLFSFPDLGMSVSSKPLLYTASAFILAALFFAFISPFMPVYVLGHEFTHWIIAKLFFKKTGSFRVGLKDGHVDVTDPNIAIVLGPYIVPIYTIVWLIIYRLTIIWYKPAWHITAFFIGLGISYAFHCVLTVKALQTDQPDLHYAKRSFSYIVIIFCNILLLYFMLAGLSGKFTQSHTILWQNLLDQWKWIISLFK